MLLNECENAKRELDTLWDNGNSVWMCQAWVNNSNRMKTHKWIDVDRYKTDEDYQLEVCRRLRQEWTPFYWPGRIEKNGKACHVNRLDKFSYIINNV